MIKPSANQSMIQKIVLIFQSVNQFKLSGIRLLLYGGAILLDKDILKGTWEKS